MICCYSFTVGLVIDSLDESTQSDDSMEKKPITPITTAIDDTNTNDSDSLCSAKRYFLVNNKIDILNE